MLNTVLRVSAASCGLRSATLLPSAVSSLVCAYMSSIPEKDTATGSAAEYYWMPHETASPASVAQRRATGRIEAAMESVLLTDGAIREQLVHRHGLNIHRVMVSKDRRSVFVLWDADDGKAQECQKALEKNAFRLRRELAKAMKSKFTPYLEFRHNHLPPLKAAAAEAMEQVAQELSVAAEAANTGDAAQHEDVEAAIARLQQQTQPREQ
eukprot:GHUV01010385.1.p1 GENE.GHUV01010385.1~~GHUV01010385.1.p1  ORF type:complete len:210 (+),score=58.24 GHUV01010385.1:942-1571(+)